MVASAFTALLLSSHVTLHVSDAVPKLDVGPTCRMESAAIDTGAQSCMKDEQDAQEQLVKGWARFNALDKNTCVALTQTGGSASYVELLTCLEMSRDARSSPAE
jgi:hypothetical protein